MGAAKLTLVQKLKSVYEKIDHIPKNGYNKTQKYPYVRAADLVHAVRNSLYELGIYAEVNFSWIGLSEFKTSSGTVMQACSVQCNITFHDTDDPTGTKYTCSGIGTGADTTDKQAYKAQTGALKYALRSAFLVPDEADPEQDDEEVGEQEEVEAEPERPIQKTQGKTTAGSKPQTTEKSEPVQKKLVKNGDEVPPADEMEGIRNRYSLLVGDLKKAGLNSTGKPQGKKLLAYLLQTTGATDGEKVTRNQWNTFFDVVSKIKSNGGDKELVKLVNEASEAA